MKKGIYLMIMLLVISSFFGCSQNAENNDNTKEVKTEAKEEVKEETEDKVEAETITKDVVLKAIEDDTVILDARNSEGFNGWILEDEKRGGHIESAKLFSANWIELFESDEKIVEYLESLNISKDNKIITYGYGEDANTLNTKLFDLGYNSEVYSAGIKEWASDEELPMNKMPDYKRLVYPKWLKEKMDTEDILVFECSWGDGAKIENIIPNSYHINTDDFEEGPLWNRKSDEEIEKALLKYGITADTKVVLYGAKDSTPPARIASIIEYAGVKEVRFLDGGSKKWMVDGYSFVDEFSKATPVEEFGVEVPANPQNIIDMEEAKQLLESENGNLISIRSWVEFIGETSGYDYIEAAGRIDGAVYGYAGSDPWHMEDYRNIDNTMLNYETIAKRWSDMGIDSEDDNSFYCGTGWRASETWLYAKAMGFKNPSVYDGGWKEWSEASMPTLTGVPESGVPEGK